MGKKKLNRAKHRQQVKVDASRPNWIPKSEEELLKSWYKNGITEKDLSAKYVEGREDGYAQGKEETIKIVYAAICLALNDLYGFGKKRCLDALYKADDYIVSTLVSDEIIQEVFDRLDITFNFKNPLNYVSEKGD